MIIKRFSKIYAIFTSSLEKIRQLPDVSTTVIFFKTTVNSNHINYILIYYIKQVNCVDQKIYDLINEPKIFK